MSRPSGFILLKRLSESYRGDVEGVKAVNEGAAGIWGVCRIQTRVS